MKRLITLLMLASLSGCVSQDYGNAMQSFSQGYNNSRDQRQSRQLQSAQLQYYQNQNLNQWRNY